MNDKLNDTYKDRSGYDHLPLFSNYLFLFLQRDSSFTDDQKLLLFGEDGLDSDKIFEKLDFDKNGEVCVISCIKYTYQLCWLFKRHDYFFFGFDFNYSTDNNSLLGN